MGTRIVLESLLTTSSAFTFSRQTNRRNVKNQLQLERVSPCETIRATLLHRTCHRRGAVRLVQGLHDMIQATEKRMRANLSKVGQLVFTDRFRRRCAAPNAERQHLFKHILFHGGLPRPCFLTSSRRPYPGIRDRTINLVSSKPTLRNGAQDDVAWANCTMMKFSAISHLVIAKAPLREFVSLCPRYVLVCFSIDAALFCWWLSSFSAKKKSKQFHF